MADIGIYPSGFKEIIESPSIALVLFAKFEFDRGNMTRRFNKGVGTRVINGEKWQGFESPEQLQLISIGDIMHPKVNVATATEITLCGVTREFLKQVKLDTRMIYGSKVTFYTQAYDTDTYQPKGNFVQISTGICGRPKMMRDASGLRQLTIVVEGEEYNKNFSPGGLLSDADQKARYPGDRMCELMGGTSLERWQ